MKTISTFIIFISALFLANISYADEKLIVSGHQEYAPFMWRDGDKIVGAGIEIVKLVFDELGIKARSEYAGPWKRMLHNLKTGKVDVLCAGYVTDERKSYAYFTEEYMAEDPVSVFVMRGKEFRFEKWDDLKGKIFGELLGASQGKEFDEWRKKNAKIQYVADRKQNLAKMERGRIDCFVSGYYGGLMNIKKLGYEGRFVPLKNPVKTNRLHVAISKKSAFLKYLPQVDQKLKKLREDGTVERIIKKNMNYYISTQVK